MTLYSFIVSYEGKLEAPDADTARMWAVEDVDAGRYDATTVEVEPISRKDAPNEHD